jgi:uncharacterized damage-inducible protein DinB
MSVLIHHFRFVAEHHRQCTVRLLEHLHALGRQSAASPQSGVRQGVDEILASTGGGCLFFNSVGGTLNHLAGAEAMWYHRLTGHGAEAAVGVAELYKLEGPALQQAWESRRRGAAAISRCVLEQCDAWCRLLSDGGRDKRGSNTAGGGDEWLLSKASYVDTEGVQCQVVRAAGLAQVFQHGVHHRGQVHAALYWLQHQQKPPHTLAQDEGRPGGKATTSLQLSLPSMDMQNMGDTFLNYAVLPAARSP